MHHPRLALPVRSCPRYDCYMVDDAQVDGLSHQESDSWDLVPPESLVFFIQSTDTTSLESIPSAAVSVKVEHRLPDGTPLFFHNTSRPKAGRTDEGGRGTSKRSTSGVLVSSFQVGGGAERGGWVAFGHALTSSHHL